ncbi:MAG: DUF2786 domain-containing protein [Sulfurimonas sp.]|nr:DUF2786 domain-containing protein [Sulfurimonas sp.]
MSEKIKNKIEKLLSLSMSDNEHEAKIALDRALKLMSEHNITEDEVHRQAMISKTITLKSYRTPKWMVTLYSRMSELSGCIMTYRNGYKYEHLDEKAIVRITGRERDVMNATYLCEFLYREIEKASKEYKKEIGVFHSGTVLAVMIKSFKMGFIRRVYARMDAQQRDFFGKAETSTELVCIDNETKCKEAKDFYDFKFGEARTVKSNAKYYAKGLEDGTVSADDLEINSAVAGQQNIARIGKC